MQIPDLNTSINTTTTTKNNFINAVILDANGKVFGSFGVLKDNNAKAKFDDMENLLSMVGYSLSLEAPEREYTRMVLPTSKK